MPFDAVGPVGGYLWQIRHALIRLIRSGPGQAIGFESFDDVVILDDDGTLRCAIQTKHSFGNDRLGIRGADLWKTLRVWMTLHRERRLAKGTRLVLHCTADLDDSIPAPFRTGADSATIDAFVAALDVVANEGPNQALTAAYQIWKESPLEDKRDLLSRVEISPSAPKLQAANDELREALLDEAVPEKKLPDIARYLVGWFDSELSVRLKAGGCKFYRKEIRENLWQLSEMYASIDLISAHGNDPYPPLEEELRSGPMYLRQLQLLDFDTALMVNAVSMFHRGVAERQEILNSLLTGKILLDEYDQDLCNNWDYARAASAELGDAKSRGTRTYHSCMNHHGAFGGRSAPVHLSRGSHHYLANQLAIGWHPDYAKLLKIGGQQ